MGLIEERSTFGDLFKLQGRVVFFCKDRAKKSPLRRPCNLKFFGLRWRHHPKRTKKRGFQIWVSCNIIAQKNGMRRPDLLVLSMLTERIPPRTEKGRGGTLPLA